MENLTLFVEAAAAIIAYKRAEVAIVGIVEVAIVYLCFRIIGIHFFSPRAAIATTVRAIASLKPKTTMRPYKCSHSDRLPYSTIHSIIDAHAAGSPSGGGWMSWGINL